MPVTECGNCHWQLTGGEIRCPSCLAHVDSSADGRPAPTGQRGARRSPGLSLLARIDGRVMNEPSVFPARPSVAGLLVGLAAAVVLLPVLLKAFLPLIVLLLLPVIVFALLFRGMAGPAVGCLGSLVRAGRSLPAAGHPGGVTFRMGVGTGDGRTEVQWRGRPPRLEMGDRVQVTGLRLASVVHVLRLRNVTTGETSVSRIAVFLVLAGLMTVLALASYAGR